MGFAFCFGSKMVSILGGEVSFRTWLYDLWKLVFACLSPFECELLVGRSYKMWWSGSRSPQN